MKQFLKWAAIILGVLVLVAVAVISVLGLFRFGGMPMMARGFHEPFRGGGYRLLLVPLMLGRLIIPLVFLALLFIGGYMIGRASRGPRVQATASTPVIAPQSGGACPNCGKAVREDWNNCPYCGTNLKGGEPSVIREDNE